MGERGSPRVGANPEICHWLLEQALGMYRSCRATTIKARNQQGPNKEA